MCILNVLHQILPPFCLSAVQLVYICKVIYYLFILLVTQSDIKDTDMEITNQEKLATVLQALV